MKQIKVPDTEDGYPPPFPPSKSKKEVFVKENYQQIDEYAKQVSGRETPKRKKYRLDMGVIAQTGTLLYRHAHFCSTGPSICIVNSIITEGTINRNVFTLSVIQNNLK